MSSYYDILGVNRNAATQEIKGAYRKLIKHYHPDKNITDSEAHRKAQIINEAYSTLKDPAKRAEYDKYLSMQEDSYEYEDRNTYAKESDETEAHGSDIPHYCCEKCGKQDSSLRITVFLWVVSVIFVTYKRGFAHILCATCRIKYSLLLNIATLFLGWWGFPWGPVYSLEALFTNLSSGKDSPENNAILLAALSYDLYLKHQYPEALACILKSNAIKPSEDKKEFIDYLKSYNASPKKEKPFFYKFFLHPAIYNIILLFITYIFVAYYADSVDWKTKKDYYSQYQRSKSVEQAKNVSDSSKTDLTRFAKESGIDIDKIDDLVAVCNSTVRLVASHIKSRVPMVEKTYKGNVIIHHYNLDREKLDEKVLNKYAEKIGSEIEKTSDIIHRYNTSPVSLKDVENRKLAVEKYLLRQLDFMKSAYFNVLILAISTEFIKEINNGSVAKETFENIFQLKDNSQLNGWLETSKFYSKYNQLIAILSEFEKSQYRINNLNNNLISLKNKIENNEHSLEKIKGNLAYFENNGMYNEYNRLVPKYNSIINMTESFIREYNDSVNELNRITKTVSIDNIDTAFNNCLDSSILFSEFDEVNLGNIKKTKG